MINLTEANIKQLQSFLEYLNNNKNLAKEIRSLSTIGLQDIINAEKSGDENSKRKSKSQWSEIKKKIGVDFLKGLAVTSDIITVGSAAYKYLFLI